LCIRWHQVASCCPSLASAGIVAGSAGVQVNRHKGGVRVVCQVGASRPSAVALSQQATHDFGSLVIVQRKCSEHRHCSSELVPILVRSSRLGGFGRRRLRL